MNERKRKYLGTKIQRKLLAIIFFSAIVPMGVAIIGLYYLVFNFLFWQVALPSEVAQNISEALKKINFIIFIGLPIIFLIIWLVALELSHRLAGPIFRLEKELDLLLKGEKTGPIQIRAKDELKSLVEKINQLIKKVDKN